MSRARTLLGLFLAACQPQSPGQPGPPVPFDDGGGPFDAIGGLPDASFDAEPLGQCGTGTSGAEGLDVTFDGDGAAVAPPLASVIGAYQSASAVLVVDEGRVLTAGVGSAGTEPMLVLARFVSDGTADGSFGGDGLLLAPGPSLTADPPRAAALADGRFYLAATLHDAGGGHARVGRFLADGAADPTFSDDGWANVADGQVIDLALQGSAPLVAVRTVSNGIQTGHLIQRLDETGAPDPSFAANGTLLDGFYPWVGSFGVRMITGDDGRIWLASLLDRTGTGGQQGVGVACYLPDGAVDPSFGETGKAIERSFTFQAVSDIDLDCAGRPVVSGTVIDPSFTPRFGAMRLTAHGVLDMSFGEGDGLTTDERAGLVPGPLLLLPDGTILHATSGTPPGETLERVMLFRFTSDGVHDLGFGVDGTRWGAQGTAAAMALQPDGKLLIAGMGWVYDPTHYAFMQVQRFLP